MPSYSPKQQLPLSDESRAAAHAPAPQPRAATAAPTDAAPSLRDAPRVVAQRQTIASLLRAAAGNAPPLQSKAVPASSTPGGLPADLKTGMESVSGIDLSDVRVHFNSALPAALQAHAYTQGSDIHIGPGQERHLPHEAWHVVQQAQGRVAPTGQSASGIPINDDASLEREADVMGDRVGSIAQRSAAPASEAVAAPQTSADLVQGKFFERTDTGAYIWHDEAPSEAFRALAETRRYHSWYNPIGLAYGAYPVYTRGAVDRHGAPLTAGRSPAETLALANIRQLIQGTAYERILDFLERRILANLGQAALDQFYRGAHIIFDDAGGIYHRVFELGLPVAKLRPQTWTEWTFGTPVAATIENLAPSTQRGAGMGSRRPEKRETSHYTADALPQIGIDLPGQLSGHILVGLVPNDRRTQGSSAGQTFVQTEMYGFKNFYDHYIGHAQGFFWNFVASHQSGLVGFCKNSEKSQTEIREQDNKHVVAQRKPMRGLAAQRKVRFDDGNPMLEAEPRDQESVGPAVSSILLRTGAVSEVAARQFTAAILQPDTIGVQRDRSGIVHADFEGLRDDRKSVFELYRQRYRLLGVIRDASRSTTLGHEELSARLRALIRASNFDEVQAVLLGAPNRNVLLAAATTLYGDLESGALGDAGQAFIRSTAQQAPPIRDMFAPLFLRTLDEESVSRRVALMRGPEAKQPFGKHHGMAYTLGLTSVSNYLADYFIEGFNPRTTSFAGFAIRPPRFGAGEPLVTGSGGQILADGWYMYIVDSRLQMMYFLTNNYVREDKAERAKIFAQYIPHTVLSGGADVWAAGTFLIRDGHFALVDNGSGHYRPAPASLNVVRGILQGMGYPTDRTHFVEFAHTLSTGADHGILPNMEGIEIGTVGKSGLTMGRPTRSPEVEAMLRSTQRPGGNESSLMPSTGTLLTGAAVLTVAVTALWYLRPQKTE